MTRKQRVARRKQTRRNLRRRRPFTCKRRLRLRSAHKAVSFRKSSRKGVSERHRHRHRQLGGVGIAEPYEYGAVVKTIDGVPTVMSKRTYERDYEGSIEDVTGI